MAKNWTPKEAFVAIKADDKAAIMDLGRRFPLMLSVLSRLVAGDSNAAGELLGGLNERVTVRTIESVLKEGVADEEETEDEVETEAVVEVAKPERREKTVAKPAHRKYDGMSAKELFTLGKERKLKVVPKQTVEEYIAILEAADKKEAAAAAAKPVKPAAKPAKPAKPVAKPAADDDWDDGDEAETEAPAEDDDWDL